jgi:hypothetical protein
MKLSRPVASYYPGANPGKRLRMYLLGSGLTIPPLSPKPEPISVSAASTSWLYVLLCQKGKIYVGKTSNPSFRLDAHFREGGSAWTRRFSPEKILDFCEIKSHHDENNRTLDEMRKHGIDNVRGASWCQIELSFEQTDEIERQIFGSSDCCYRCGNRGHFASSCRQPAKISGCLRCGRSNHLSTDCYASTSVEGFPLDESSSEEEIDAVSTSIACYRCGYPGHFSKTCYARRHISGRHLK